MIQQRKQPVSLHRRSEIFNTVWASAAAKTSRCANGNEPYNDPLYWTVAHQTAAALSARWVKGTGQDKKSH